ncbi:hypothetical protein N7G274_005630 [Stereocaulon virgatum]|uniref:F-box domain-containing protein n=1 Tax=Stereocaulon virgatum TaxID=373712 RepID=A0ABR4A8V4_9LECA
MPHSTLPQQSAGTRKSSNDNIEERFQAGLQLQALYALPIYQLPAEVMLNILNNLTLEDYPAFIPAAWHLLRHHGIVPPYTTSRLKQILIEPRKGFFGSFEHATDKSREGHGFLPMDIRQLINSRLAPGPPFFNTFTDVGRRMRGGFQRLPNELKDYVYRKLDPAAMTILTLACHRFSNRDIEWLTHEEV